MAKRHFGSFEHSCWTCNNLIYTRSSCQMFTLNCRQKRQRFAVLWNAMIAKLFGLAIVCHILANVTHWEMFSEGYVARHENILGKIYCLFTRFDRSQQRVDNICFAYSIDISLTFIEIKCIPNLAYIETIKSLCD